MTEPADGYVAHDEDAVWGYGPTAAAALAHARSAIGNPNDPHPGEEQAALAGLATTPATAALLAALAAHGPRADYLLRPDGVMDLDPDPVPGQRRDPLLSERRG